MSKTKELIENVVVYNLIKLADLGISLSKAEQETIAARIYNDLSVYGVIEEPDRLNFKHQVTRVEVIDGGGRAYSVSGASNVMTSLQDDRRTLKVFLNSGSVGPFKEGEVVKGVDDSGTRKFIGVVLYSGTINSTVRVAVPGLSGYRVGAEIRKKNTELSLCTTKDVDDD